MPGPVDLVNIKTQMFATLRLRQCTQN